MRKLLLATILWGAAAPANAVTLFIEAEFGPTTKGPAKPGTNFILEITAPDDFRPNTFTRDVTLIDFAFAGFDMQDVVWSGGQLSAVTRKDNSRLWGIGMSVRMSSGETAQTFMLIKKDGSALFESRDRGVNILAPGGGFVGIWDDPTLKRIAFDPRNIMLPAPEPATWAMMIGGFALAGAALRRRTKIAYA